MCQSCVPDPIPSRAIPPAAEPTGHSEGGGSSPGLAAFLPSDKQLEIRIEAADTHLMRLLHLYEIGNSIVARMPSDWPCRDALQWVFDLQRERIAWARETLITDDERETHAFLDVRRRLLAPQSVQED